MEDLRQPNTSIPSLTLHGWQQDGDAACSNHTPYLYLWPFYSLFSVHEIRMQHNELYVQEAQPLTHRYVWFMWSETYEKEL